MRLLIAVATCHKYRYFGTLHADSLGGQRVNLIRETWKSLVPADVDLKFFYGRRTGIHDMSLRVPKDDEVFLDVHDAVFALPRKVQGIFRWAREHGYDGVLKLDDDVFVNVPAFLKSNFADHDYLGCATNPGGSQVPFTFVCGFAMWLSRKAMDAVADAEVPWVDFDKEFSVELYNSLDNVGKIPWCHDLWIGQVLAEKGIIAQDDEHYIVSVCEENGGPSTYPLDKAFAVHLTPRFELMHELYGKVTHDIHCNNLLQSLQPVEQHPIEHLQPRPLRSGRSGRWNGRRNA